MALLAARYGEGAMLCINPDDVAEAVEIVCKRDVVTPSPETIGLEDLLLSKGIIWFFASFWRSWQMTTILDGKNLELVSF